jgi:guanine deaminase
MLRESARLANQTGAYWQTHLSEDRGELAEVERLFPDAIDYLDVYDRAGGLGPRTVLAHAIHLSEREIGRLAETGTRVAHCPASNLFLASGVMPLARYLEAGIAVGLGSDVAAGPDLSIFGAMRVGAYTQHALRVVGGDPRPILGPLDWLRMGSLEGARALSIDDVTGSIEPGKDADLILVDPRATDPLVTHVGESVDVGRAGRGLSGPAMGLAGEADRDGAGSDALTAVPSQPDLLADSTALVSRLVFRPHPAMVRAAWVRGRLLPGPPATLLA